MNPKGPWKCLLGNKSILKTSGNSTLRLKGESIARLLEALLSDWIDFEFTPAPALLVIYADHDEFITFYSNDELSLEKLVKDLQASGFELVKDWRRPKGYRQISR